MVNEGPKRFKRGKCAGIDGSEEKDIEELLGTIPYIDRSEPVYVPSYAGAPFKHANDKANDERYHRAYHMLRMLRYVVSNHHEGSTFKEKWERLWEQEKLFSKTEVDHEYYAPPWMRKVAS